MLQFQHVPYLLALLAIPLIVALYMLALRWKKKTIKKIGDEQLVKQLISNYSPKKYFTKFLLLILAFSLAAIGWAGLREPDGTSNIKHTGIDVMIALDVSKSMLAKDIQPNRLERARQLISKIIDKLPDDRIGIVVFAGRAYLQMPLTTDHSAAKMYLSSATPDVVPTQGTVIGDALKMCFNAFNNKEKKYKTIILISDGEDHDESAIKVTRSLADEGVMINTVGIGSPGGSTIIDPATGETKKDAAGAIVITRLNEEVLKNVAANGNGLYQLFTTSNEVANKLEGQLKSIDQRPITENASATYRYFYQWFVGVALLLLLVEFFMSEKTGVTRFQSFFLKKNIFKNNAAKPTFNKALLLAFCCIISATPLFAQKENVLIKKGNTAYNNKQLDVAIDNYKKAIEINPSGNKANFNLGNALYKNGNTEDAVKAYESAIANSNQAMDKSKAWFNTGVVLQNKNKLPECIDAYKNALKQDPSDEDARLNLQKAIQKQQQQKQKEEAEKKKDKPQQQKQDKNQPKPQPNKMTKKEAEEKLKALMQQEKNLQDKLRKVDAASPDKPEKDW